MDKDSPLRVLVKSYESGLLNRHQYLEIRQQLLKKLSSAGDISPEDLKNFMAIYQEAEQPDNLTSYTVSDWIIIILGLIAAASLGIFLYN